MTVCQETRCQTSAASSSWLTITTVLLVTMTPQYTGAQEPSTFDAGTANQLGLTFSPDGSDAYWVAWNGHWGGEASNLKTIYVSQRSDDRWSPPAPMAFSGEYHDDDPFVSPDGRWLYFVSERPSGADDANPDADIWRYGLSDGGRLERLAVNSEAAEYSPVVTASGALYFASARAGGIGDIYRAAPSEHGFQAPQPIGPAVNSQSGEWNVWVAADESELLFEASSRPSNVSTPGDLYYSWQTRAGWTPAVAVESLNSDGSDLMPRVHPDGETLYYTTAPIGGHAALRSTAWADLRKQLRAAHSRALLVANRASHEVVFLDLAEGQVKHRLSTGEGPHLLSNVDNGRVLATGFGVFPRPHADPVEQRPPFVEVLNSRLTLIDATQPSVLVDSRVTDCRRPHASWLLGNRAFVTCEDEQRIVEIDLDGGETVRTLDTLQQGSHVLAFEPGSRTLAVANTDAGSVTLFDTNTGAARVVELAAGSEGLLAIDGRFWVGNARDGSVSVVDPRRGRVVEHIESVGGFPVALSADARGQVWVACFGSAELVAIDRDDFRIRRRLPLDGQPLHVLVHPHLDIAYVSWPRANAVAEIDLFSGRTVRHFRVGIEPDGLRWGP